MNRLTDNERDVRADGANALPTPGRTYYWLDGNGYTLVHNSVEELAQVAQRYWPNPDGEYPIIVGVITADEGDSWDDLCDKTWGAPEINRFPAALTQLFARDVLPRAFEGAQFS